jgi:protein-disulfide isomerase
MKRTLSFVAVLAVAVGGIALWSSQNTQPGVSLGSVSAQDAAEVDTSGVLEMSMGNPDAAVTVIEYASFTCPHCASFHEGTFKELKENYIDTDKINFVYREVYFDRFGLWGGMVARCGGPEKYFGIADLIYQNQANWTSSGDPATIADELKKLGLLAGLSQETVDACMQDGDMAKAMVAVFQQNAEADGITSTPSFVINGENYSNMSYEQFSQLLDEKLGS